MKPIKVYKLKIQRIHKISGNIVRSAPNSRKVRNIRNCEIVAEPNILFGYEIVHLTHTFNKNDLPPQESKNAKQKKIRLQGSFIC